MIVPEYWAEAKRPFKTRSRTITIRRFGWSDLSAADAQAMAESRADEALASALAGQPVARREKKAAYNGAEGTPIREEVLSRHGDAVITRNSYGAHCLNTPNVLFADVDIDKRHSGFLTTAVFFGLLVLAATLWWLLHKKSLASVVAFSALCFSSRIASAIHAARISLRGGHEKRAVDRLRAFLLKRPLWSIRVYRTPAGLRLLATHQLFDPSDAEVLSFFVEVQADPVYVRMCSNQRCFRARLTAKPWRIGIASHMRPRPGIWPVKPEHLPMRHAWIAEYESTAKAFAACQFLQTLGSGAIHIDAQATIDLHDQETRALQSGNLPLA